MNRPLPSARDVSGEAFLEGLELIAQAAESCGFTVIPVPLNKYRRSVEADRREDRRQLESGEVTATQLQERNSFFKGTIELLDKSPSYA